jgi:copper chaperone NosL
MWGKAFFTISLLISLILITGCEPKPQPIHFGSDQCDYCRMMITEQEFASQAVNMQGRAFKFDSVECMAAFDLTAENQENIHSLWVPDFQNRGEWIEAKSAVYLHSETLRSPMGLFLSAYADRASATPILEEYGGEIVDYNRVKEIVEAAWLQNDDNIRHMHQ